jgi:hypothetical protein
VIIARTRASLESADDMTSLDFATGLVADELPLVIERLGLGVAGADGEHVWFTQDGIVQLAGSIADDEWLAQLSAMFAYASTRGWVDGAGRVRAHRSR